MATNQCSWIVAWVKLAQRADDEYDIVGQIYTQGEGKNEEFRI